MSDENPKFEYTARYYYSIKGGEELADIADDLDSLGIDGWELLMKIDDKLIFKRRLNR